MRWYLVLSLLTVATVIAEDESELPLAESCDRENCRLPDCRCSSTDIPGGLNARDTPQFFLLTFDDAVTVNNIETYRDVLYNRLNSNGCPASATFYVSHEYTNYHAVNELYNNGHEIALHSISHRTPQTFWAEASYDELKEEFVDQRIQMAHFANIPLDEINGIRIPFLQMSGNTSFQVMADHGIKYDATWPTVSFRNPGLWPYTLDYASTQDCTVPPCPTASIPGSWVFPMVSWTDLAGFPCSFVDACFSFPDRTDDEAWFNFIMENFERHYFGNRAPFGFYVHESYLASYPAVRRALVRFLDTINKVNDIFMVSTNEALEWTRNPVPVNEYRQQPCKRQTFTTCPLASCGPIVFGEMSYWMTICNVCPTNYPWVGNPLGQ